MDDCLLILREVLPLWEYDQRKDKLTQNPNSRYRDMEADVRTMSVLVDIANSIDEDIQMEMDCPSKNTNVKLPILDTEMWIQYNKVIHSFYRKPMATPYTIMYQSGASVSTKRTTILREGLIRFYNTSQRVSKDEMDSIMTCYMKCLRISGVTKNIDGMP